MHFKFVETPRRVREDRRFVAGHGRFVADVRLPGMVHVALVPSGHAAARIVDIDAAAALKMPGVHAVITGAELAAAVEPMMNGLDTPNVRRFPLAVGQVRYNGEWVAAVAADSRAGAEDAAELVEVELRSASVRARRRNGAEAGQCAGASGARIECVARSHLRLG